MPRERASPHCVRPFVQMVHDPAFVAARDKRHLMLSSGERTIFPVIDAGIPSWFLPRGYPWKLCTLPRGICNTR